jgi:hypothetical protein
MTSPTETVSDQSEAPDQDLQPIASMHGLGRPDKRMLYVFTGVLGGLPVGFPKMIAEEFDASYAGKEDIDDVAEMLNEENDVVLGRFFNRPSARRRAIAIANAGNAALMAVNVSTPHFIVLNRLEEVKADKLRRGCYARPRFDPTDPDNLSMLLSDVQPATVDEGIHFVMNLKGSPETDSLLNVVEYRLGQLGLLEQ